MPSCAIDIRLTASVGIHHFYIHNNIKHDHTIVNVIHRGSWAGEGWESGRVRGGRVGGWEGEGWEGEGWEGGRVKACYKYVIASCFCKCIFPLPITGKRTSV